MCLDEKQVYILNPAYILRRDKGRVAFYHKEGITRYGTLGWNEFIHPQQAMFLSFFSYRRSLGENIQLISRFIKKDIATTRQLIYPFIENQLILLTRWKEYTIRFPQWVLVNIEKVGDNYTFHELSWHHFSCEQVDLHSRRHTIAPIELTLMLTNRCVTRCNYCYADTHTPVRQFISTRRLLAIIKEAAGLNMRFVNLIGGEIFLHPDWPVLLKTLVDYDLSPQYLSTKMPVTPRILEQLQSTGYKNPLQISLDAVDETILQHLLKVNRNYRAAMENSLRLLDQSGINYRIATILTTANKGVHVIRELFDFINSLENVTEWSVSPATDSLYIDPELFKKIKLTRKELLSIFSFIRTELVPLSHCRIMLNEPAIEKTYYQCETGSRDFEGAYCSALNYHMFVLPDGKVTICEQLYWDSRFIIGDLNRQSIQEVWSSERAIALIHLKQDSIQSQSSCSKCGLFSSCFNACNRCWVNVLKAYGSENWDYPDPRCRKAPKMIFNLTYK